MELPGDRVHKPCGGAPARHIVGTQGVGVIIAYVGFAYPLLRGAVFSPSGTPMVAFRAFGLTAKLEGH